MAGVHEVNITSVKSGRSLHSRGLVHLLLEALNDSSTTHPLQPFKTHFSLRLRLRRQGFLHLNCNTEKAVGHITSLGQIPRVHLCR